MTERYSYFAWFQCQCPQPCTPVKNDSYRLAALLVNCGSMVVPGTGSRWAAPLRGVLGGFGIFFLGSLSDLWMHLHAERLLIALMADALIGVGVGLLVFLYERRQRQNLIRKLEVIRLMNHHVRNSLQVISFAASVSQQEALANKIRDAVERIEWALREVLPDQGEDISDLPLHDHSNKAAHKRKTVA